MISNQPISITIITGFLGAGKTTLLNHILQAQTGGRLAVLLNDFGSINIDAELIQNMADRVVSLANGCICCSIRKDLHATVLEMVNLANPPEHILIETSGVANPLAVVTALDKPDLCEKICLASVITVVDAEQVRSLTGEIAQLAKVQILAANTLLLNKVDLVTNKQLSAVHDWLGALNPGASVFEVTFGRAPMDVMLLAEARAGQRESLIIKTAVEPQICEVSAEADQVVLQNHELVFDVWTYTSPVPIRVTSFQAFINHLPMDIYRVKGFLHLAERPKTRTILQKVGHRITLSGGEAWSGTPQTWLVFIGAKGSLDEAELEAEMEKCQVPWWLRLVRKKG